MKELRATRINSSMQKIVVILVIQCSLLSAQGTHPSKDPKRVNVCSTVATCLKILDRDPSNVAALEQLGLVYDGIHQYQKAQTALASAAHLDPKSARIQYELGGVEEEVHQPERALEAYERSAALDPYSPTALLNLGDAYAELRRYDDAIKAYRVVITLKPDYGKAYYKPWKCLQRSQAARGGPSSLCRCGSIDACRCQRTL
jgi:tetratricopeptide (TPR) repeat protein